ncbi:hypothetical protein [Pseudomonas sp. 10S4]|uniref:hypothetical protein n=1 Tax=Pseudomonas sp. 10S4 TaxID=3048583 RepID=UPI002AC9E869|nr:MULTISPECIES: hypothetical protein [unclassified Pseudomonas]MEB0224070.1 hypothetical protein [Pseudomonas sp. 5S1]MEB0295477.1 hypothetical protein [Pseudomonas sp. 10S4]WPX20107.1 hypothetical protein RHM58_09270 [Pseudomonas sp. 10S4]
MNKRLQNSTSWSDTLKIRKAYLNDLLKIISAGAGKTSQMQTLTINAIKAEMVLIDSQLNRRK